MTGRGRWLRVGVLAVLAGSPAMLRADVEAKPEQRFSFDCSLSPLVLDDAMRQELADSIGRKWNIGVLSAEVLQSKVTVRVCLSDEERPENLILLTADGPTRDAAEQLYQTARRAILRTAMDGGLPLPRDADATSRVLDLVFDAKGMRTE